MGSLPPAREFGWRLRRARGGRPVTRSAPSPRAQTPQRGERLLAPREHRPAPVLSTAERDEPVRELRVARRLLPELPLNPVVGVEERAVACLDGLALGD